jgi:site-specific DNA-methyltransferase (cytosine-N4-specific)
MKAATKYLDTTWDFIGANTKKYTHCYHAYPAMMIPQIAERIIIKYGSHAKTLFDPYCGTGTSLVEGNLRNIDTIGTDLNPLARLLAKTKTTRLSLQFLDLYLKDFNDYLLNLRFNINRPCVVVPEIKNIDYWFSPNVQNDLALIKDFIDKVENSEIADFFRVAFSGTVRESSWTRNSEFKMFRMTTEQMSKFNPDAFRLMQIKLERNRKGLQEFLTADVKATTKVFDFNTVEKVENILNESIDIVVTSPPYGDSRTTVAYGQFSRLANEWLGIEDATLLDNKLMGGKRSKEAVRFDFPLLDGLIDQIGEKDAARVKDVTAFYADYQESIQNVAKTVKRGGSACYVVGNRKVKGVSLPTDEITRHFFENQGFSHIETVVRNIPNKRMPSKNSPSNVTGALDTTMCHEYVVIMQKN